jgi:prepilin-type N-terminal cleavage/methylation domain-containing protein
MRKNGLAPLQILKDSDKLIDCHRKFVMGFTFIELIVSISILAIIAASIYSAFNIGLQAYKRSSADQEIQKIRTKLAKIDKELKNSFFFSEIPFSGTSSEIIFPQVVSKEDVEKIYTVTYYIEKDKNAEFYRLIRKAKIYTDKPQDEKEEITDVFSAISIKFVYAYKSSDSSKGYEWQEIWGEDQKTLPSGVRIFFQIDDGGEICNKTVFLMQGALGVK